ncbi:MAG: hypothetical protein JST52_01160 [Bacteroidetes bacterium]|nr:hypothetical protein [Bacteroidota bacterium]MBS1739194.1 hypothetical protein [Bacteroidota bacterium]
MLPKTLSIVFIYVIFVSCSNSSNGFLDAEKLLSDSCVLVKAKESSYIRFSSNKNQINFLCFSNNINIIYKYNQQGIIIDSISVPSNITEEKYGYSQCMDSVFFFIENKNLVIKKQNDKVDTFTYNQTNNIKQYLSNIFFEFNYTGDKFVLLDIPDYYIPDKQEFKAYFQREIISILTLEQHKIKKIDSFGKFPDSYHSTYFNSCYPITSEISNNNVAYIFNNENILHVYDINTKHITNYKLSEISNFKMEPCDMNQLGLQYREKYCTQNPIYERILYDSKSHQWLLMQTIGISVEDKDGYLTTDEDKPLAIYVLDNNFKIIKKLLFKDNNNLNLRSTFFFNHKLYIGTNKKSLSGKKVMIYDIR